MSAAGRVLVIDAGSSSLKYRLVDVQTGGTAAKGAVSEIGGGSRWQHRPSSGATTDRAVDVRDHAAAFDLARDSVAGEATLAELVAVGHRVVHGGPQFSGPVRVDDDVLRTLRGLAPLAPLHNPANVEGIERAMDAFPGVPNIAVFDTAFHRTLPPASHTYALPTAWRREHHVRRYGFHGTSYASVTRRTARLLGRRVEDLRMVLLHLGNGASACAVDGGRSVETSMGLSPAEGLVMGTRAGDVDPTVAGYLARVAGLDAGAVEDALNEDSGLLGLGGVSDFRVLLERREAGDAAAALAFDVTVHRLVKYVGAYAAVLGGVDALVFTAGIGENSPVLRAVLAERLGLLGVSLDAARNLDGPAERRISAGDSRVPVWVVPTDEEREVAREALSVLDVDHDW